MKAASSVFINAEAELRKGDEELAYVYFVKYFHVYSQLRATNAYASNNKSIIVS